MFTISGIISLLQFVAAIAFVILVHEAGHFLVARLVKIPIQEFGIGFPPRLLTLFEAGGTKFTLNWIPLGGFVRPKGDNDPDDPEGIMFSSPWARLALYFAGSLMNFLLGIALFTFIFYQLGAPILNEVQITQVVEGAPADLAALEIGDRILAINGETIDSTQEVIEIINTNKGVEIEIELSRNGEIFTTSLTPRAEYPDNQGPTGIGLNNPTKPIPFGEAVTLGFQQVSNQIGYLLNMVGSLVGLGNIEGSDGRLVGLKGMYDMYSYFREADTQLPVGAPSGINTLGFFASISVSLGLINLFPIPTFDGSRILVTIPEIIFRKRVPDKYLSVFYMVGLALILIIMLYVNVQDFINPIVLPE